MSQPVLTESVWKLLSVQLRSFLTARVDDPSTVDDLLQELFLKIHQKLPQLGQASRLEAWVFQIARNLVIDFYRRRKESPSLPDDATTPPDNSHKNLEIGDWLSSAVDTLPEAYRDAVKLYEFENKPQQEIAEQLGISLSAAKSRIQRGRAKLKNLLEDCCSLQFDRRGNVIEYVRRSSRDADCCQDGAC